MPDNHRFTLSLPARINLLGNPSDGNEGDFATLSAAIHLRAHALIERADGIVLEAAAADDPTGPATAALTVAPADLPLPYDGHLDLVKGALNRLHVYSPAFRDAVRRHGFRLRTWTDVPRQSGLGGSSLFVLLALAGLRALYGLDPPAHHDYVLAELAQRVEEKELGITCGFADRYVPLFGGLGYVEYRGKLHHQPLFAEPFATYERLTAWAGPLALVACATGIRHDSGDVHGPMRARYLEEHADWQRRGGDPPPLVRLMQGAYETAWRGKIALLGGDMAEFGALMDRNHALVDAMMARCGFADGAGWANNRLIEAARERGALGAKLTGAGGGGSVFALVRPGEEETLVEGWERVCADEGLTDAQVYVPRIEPDGLRIEAG